MAYNLDLRGTAVTLTVGASRHEGAFRGTRIDAIPTLSRDDDILRGYSLAPSAEELSVFAERRPRATVHFFGDREWPSMVLAQLSAHAKLGGVPASDQIVEDATALPALVSYGPASKTGSSFDAMDILLRIDAPVSNHLLALIDALLLKPGLLRSTRLCVEELSSFARPDIASDKGDPTWDSFLAGTVPWSATRWSLTVATDTRETDRE